MNGRRGASRCEYSDGGENARHDLPLPDGGNARGRGIALEEDMRVVIHSLDELDELMIFFAYWT